MNTLTKSTLITWVSMDAQINIEELNAERVDKLLQMTAEEKTDGYPSAISDVETRRDFVDQAAAEEYRDFIFAMDEKYGPGLVVSVEIIDAT
jgi:hypothetical protein